MLDNLHWNSYHQKEYPQVYLADEIIKSLKYPPAPNEPTKPRRTELTLPEKYPSIGNFLICFGASVVCFPIFLLLKYYIDHWFVWLILFISGIGIIMGLLGIISSILESRTYADRLTAYNNALNEYENLYSQYKELFNKYLEDKKIFDEKFKTQRDILEYRVEQRRLFLQEVKPKSRHHNFYHTGSVNPKIGRAEHFFRNYIDNAILNGLIPIEYDFLYNTSVESFSLSNRDFYPDILVLTPRGLLINIEIDEPYVYETKEPIHFYDYMKTSRDYYRNKEFAQHNCSVIRFTERQVLKYPDICLNIILSFDDNAYTPKHLITSDDFIEKVWTRDEAIRMAQESYRDTY